MTGQESLRTVRFAGDRVGTASLMLARQFLEKKGTAA